MKKELEFEMRPEYDFSGGVRGRHAARFTGRERDELFRRAAVQDLQTWIAHALLQVQALEAALFTYLVLAQDDSPEQAGVKTTTLFDSGEARGLKHLMSELRDRGLPEGELDEKFWRVVNERNWLVHRSGYESQAALSVSQKTLLLLKRLEYMSDEAHALKVQIEHLVQHHLSIRGLSKQEIDKTTDETVGLWLAA